MDTKQFLAEFGHIAHAPEGIARLRELIYQLAVTGRLTSQDEKDSDAADVLNNVARIRQQLIAGKKYKRSPKLESFNLVPPAIDLPPNWRWSRLLDLGEINPRNQAEEAAMATFVPMAGVSEKHSKEISGEIKPWSKIYKGYTHFANGDVLLAKITPCFENGKAAVVSGLKNDIGAGSTEFHVFRSISQFIDPGYVYLFLRSPLFRAKGEASMTGTAGQKRLPTDYFALCAMPLPPTAEQSRIVANVDELMALCDKLEAQQQARRKLQNNLRQSTLQAVASASSSHELKNSWTRLADNFGRLFYGQENVADLRNLILDLAANGFLSEPQVGDGDPLAIISQASLQQKVEFSARELREINALPELTHENGRFRIALGRIVKLVSGQHLSPEEYNIRQDGIPYITGPAEFKDRRPSPTKWTTERRAIARVGDVLITVKGSGVGKTAICDLEELAISRQLMAIRALANLDRRYLLICIDSAERSFQEQKFGIAIPGIGRDEVLALTVLLPSIEEQSRIVRRVDELMRLCDSLESQLRIAEKVAGRLIISAVSNLTGLTIEQEEEPMKAPQIELIAPLRLGTAPDIKAQAPLATILARHNGEMSAKDLWQRFNGEIDAFYAQLKTEVAHGWILEPAPAEVREKTANTVSA
ncbi:restriction endonuclease subunit S [Pectobacterium punjabense]|uniref:restriction endonuclease subunit S n=1 Tax=Pectobacterium punjabense TaxID=2108399 RepID=UPI0019691549|nr:restriction endonuclease subunit S [Pectobacterium punjabense]MBN3137931.1 restriction endonuclease subunit S [Pectobacterium punjabense]MCE5382060.1 restriction endonuclease subunit S [Pectobacterium punjabense]